MRTTDEARRFLEQSPTFWWQSFELVPGVWTPGAHHIRTLLAESDLPANLSGKSVLDVGAANGAVCFELERRGATRIIGADIISGTDFGFELTRDFLGSQAEFICASIYELPEILSEQLHVVVFYGVLYHLRHPLLALDTLYRLVRPDGMVLIETAVSDGELLDAAERSVSALYPGDGLNGDPTNWFAPTVRCLVDWCESSGFSVEILARHPEERPVRCLLRAHPRPGPPAYRRISYERPLRTVVA